MLWILVFSTSENEIELDVVIGIIDITILSTNKSISWKFYSCFHIYLTEFLWRSN